MQSSNHRLFPLLIGLVFITFLTNSFSPALSGAISMAVAPAHGAPGSRAPAATPPTRGAAARARPGAGAVPAPSNRPLISHASHASRPGGGMMHRPAASKRFAFVSSGYRVIPRVALLRLPASPRAIAAQRHWRAVQAATTRAERRRDAAAGASLRRRFGDTGRAHRLLSRAVQAAWHSYDAVNRQTAPRGHTRTAHPWLDPSVPFPYHAVPLASSRGSFTAAPHANGSVGRLGRAARDPGAAPTPGHVNTGGASRLRVRASVRAWSHSWHAAQRPLSGSEPGRARMPALPGEGVPARGRTGTPALPLSGMIPGRSALARASVRTLAQGMVVSGTISANTTWSLAGSPYIVAPCVRVAAGATLTVGPGVVVKFVPHAACGAGGASGISTASLIVDGALVAVGTATQPITFTSNNDISPANGGDTTAAGAANPGAPMAGDWGDIIFQPDAARGASSLVHAQVLYGQAVVDNNTAPTIHDDSVARTTLGLQFYAATGMTITNETVTNTIVQSGGSATSAGIVFNAPVQGVTLTGDTLDTPASGDGIILSAGGSGVTIANDDVQAGSQGGVIVGGPLTSATIRGNTVAASTAALQAGGGSLYAFGISLNAADGVTVVSNTIAGAGTSASSYAFSNGLRVGPCAAPAGGNGVTIAGNTLTGLGAGSNNGISVDGCAATIRDNTVDGVAGSSSGIVVSDQSAATSITGNHVAVGSLAAGTGATSYNSGIVVSGVYAYNACACVVMSGALRIAGNTVSVAGGSNSGVYLNGRGGGAVIADNIVALNSADLGASGVYLGDVAVDASIIGNTVRDGASGAARDGIVFAAEADNATVADNTVTNVEGPDGGIVFLGSARGDTVYGNRLYGNLQGGILFNPPDPTMKTPTTPITADNTIVSYNVAAGGAAGVAVIDANTPTPLVLDHNTLVDNTGAGGGIALPGAGNVAGGVLLSGAAPVVTDSLIISNTAGIATSASPGDRPALGYNDVAGNTAGDYAGVSEAPTPNGDLSADPLFANPIADDFTLTAGSPAIGAAADGTDLGAPQTGAPAPRVLFGSAAPNPFTPADATNNQTAAGYVLSAPLTVTVLILTAGGAVYRTLQPPTPEPAGAYNLPWDGTDGNGRTAPDGSYTASIQGADVAGTTVSRLDLSVAVAAPSFTLSAPAAHTLSNGDTVTAAPSPQLSSSLTGVTLCAGSAATAGCTYTLTTLTSRGNGAWSGTAAVPDLLQVGTYDLFLAYSYAGATQGGVHDLGAYTVAAPPVLTLSQSAPYPDPTLIGPRNVSSNAFVSWSYFANAPLSVTLAITGPAQNAVTTVTRASSGGYDSIAWDGTAGGRLVPDGVYTLTIAARDATGAPAAVRYGGNPATTTATDTVIGDALSLSSPVSGAVVGGSVAVAASVAPLLTPLLSSPCPARFVLVAVSDPSRTYGVGPCLGLSGTTIAGTIDTTAAPNGQYGLDVYLSTGGPNGASGFAEYRAGILTVHNAPAFIGTPSAAPDPFTPNGDGANDTYNVALTPNADVTATLSITDPLGNPVTGVITRVAAGQAATLSWAGVDASGAPVPDAPNYQAGLTIVDGSGQSASDTAFSPVGVAHVPFTLTAPLPGASITGAATFTVTASPGLDNAHIYAGPTLLVQPAGATGSSGAVSAGTLVQVGSNPDGGIVYALTVDPPTALGDGRYDLYADLDYNCAVYCYPMLSDATARARPAGHGGHRAPTVAHSSGRRAEPAATRVESGRRQRIHLLTRRGRSCRGAAGKQPDTGRGAWNHLPNRSAPSRGRGRTRLPAARGHDAELRRQYRADDDGDGPGRRRGHRGHHHR